MTAPTDDLIVIRAKTMPSVPGYHCIGWTSNTCWPEWADWIFLSGRLTYSALIEPPPMTPRQQIAAGQLRLEDADVAGGEPVPLSEPVAIVSPEEALRRSLGLIAAMAAAPDALIDQPDLPLARRDALLALDFAKASQAKQAVGDAITPEEDQAIAHVDKLYGLLVQLEPETPVAPTVTPEGSDRIPDAFRDAFDEQPPADGERAHDGD